MANFIVNIAEGAYDDVKAALASVGHDLTPIVQDGEAAAKAAWASIETSFNNQIPALAGQALGLLEALLTGGEVAAAALIPADVAVDLTTAKTALTNAVSAAKASLLPVAPPATQ